jgi:hypothetical protein
MQGVTDKHVNYTLLMALRCKERGGKCHAIKCNGICFFSDSGLSKAKLIPGKDRYKYAPGVALVTYSIGARIKKFQEQGEAGVSKELTQMHDISVFHPVT